MADSAQSNFEFPTAREIRVVEESEQELLAAYGFEAKQNLEKCGRAFWRRRDAVMAGAFPRRTAATG